MALPEAGVMWPPLPYTRIAGKLQSWAAWYSGDPDALAMAYGAAVNNRDGSKFDQYGMLIDRPTQYRGGLVGKFARWFWGAPTPLGEKRHKLHIPIGGDLAATSADLLFGQMPDISGLDIATQDLVEELNNDGLHASLLEAAELAAALGGAYLKVCWDLEISAHPWMDVAHADAAIPEWQWNKLAAVTFWRVLEGPDSPGKAGTMVLRHLERHEAGMILHGLYEGTVDNLGRPVPLTEHADTRALAGIVNEQSAVPTGTTKLTAVYVPNMRPNRLWRTDPAATYLGRSDYAGVEPLMDALDETWTSWMRDIRLGKARLIVPNAYLQNLGPGKGSMFDLEQEVFTGLDMLPQPGQTGNMITENQFVIRVAEHATTAAKITDQIIRDAGYSTQTFGELDVAGGRPTTATEVLARERKTMTTRSRKIGYWRAPLRDFYETLLQVDAQINPGGGVTPDRPVLEWPDAIEPDPQATAQTIQMLRAAEAASIETSVRMFHPDWDDPLVTEEVARIRDDLASMPSPHMDPFALNPPGGQPSGGTGQQGAPGDPASQQ